MFTSATMVSFRRARKIRDYLLRAKLHLLQQNIGSRNCNEIDVKCVVILKVQISFLVRLLVRQIK